MRKCRNWQTSKTKDLVIIAIVWVQVPSSALRSEKALRDQGFFCYIKYGIMKHADACAGHQAPPGDNV